MHAEFIWATSSLAIAHTFKQHIHSLPAWWMSCQRKHSGGIQLLKRLTQDAALMHLSGFWRQMLTPLPFIQLCITDHTPLVLEGWAGGVAISAKKLPWKEFSTCVAEPEKHQCPGRSKQPYKCTESIDAGILFINRNGSFKWNAPGRQEKHIVCTLQVNCVSPWHPLWGN